MSEGDEMSSVAFDRAEYEPAVDDFGHQYLARRHVTPEMICGKLIAWADAAGLPTTTVSKSDLLARLIYGAERGPSHTPCPVHKGKWSGCHFGWPGSIWRHVGGAETPMDVDPKLQELWDAGCRCATHKGSSCTTGWNPDEHCCGDAT